MRNMTFRAVGIMLAAIAFASLASSALASEYEVKALPEVGRCVKVATGTGTYEGSKCVTVETGNKGKYDFQPLTTALAEVQKPTFSVLGTEVVLTTAGAPTITCITGAISGEYTGPKSSSEKAVFDGCTAELSPGVTSSCQSGLTAEVIEVPAAEGEIGYIKNAIINGKRIIGVGLDLRPQPPSTALVSAVCAPGTPSTETVAVEGSVIARITPFDVMTTKVKLAYRVSKAGHQIPEKFEGGLKDTLTTTFTGLSGSTAGASALAITGISGTSSTPLEIKAK